MTLDFFLLDLVPLCAAEPVCSPTMLEMLVPATFPSFGTPVSSWEHRACKEAHFVPNPPANSRRHIPQAV